MASYEKPEIIVSDDLAEGVYAASGDAAPTSGVGVNVSWTERSSEPEHDGRPHWIRKYNLSVPAAFEGKMVHYNFTLHGPVRHAGGHHEQNKVLNGNILDFDVHYSSSHDNYLFVCCEPEYYPDGLTVLTGSCVLKSDV